MTTTLQFDSVARRHRLVRALCALLVVSAFNAAQPCHCEPLRILVYSRTTGFRHDSIPAGIQAVQQLGTSYGFEVVATEDPLTFVDSTLAQFNAVVFLQTTGNPLEGPQRSAFERFIQSGNGFVGVHAASDVDGTWPWYVQLLGGRFASHPAIQPATIGVVDASHPSTHHLDSEWHRTDEWYNFQNVNPNIHTLLNLTESSYEGGTMGSVHPVAWMQAFDGGRSWYTAGGHTSASYQEDDFLQHLAGGILWAAVRPGDFNRDGSVDGADYVTWRDSQGNSGLGQPADGNGDGQVDAQDYQLWRAHFTGTGNDPTFSRDTVPEPSFLVHCLTSIAIITIAVRRVKPS